MESGSPLHTMHLLPTLHFLVYLLVLGSTTHSSVSAIRYAFQENFTIFNPGCNSSDTLETCNSPYLSEQGLNNPIYEFGWAAHSWAPEAYFLCVTLTFYGYTEYIKIVWSANRNRPVSQGAWFTFHANGSLVLYDSDGSEVWSTRTNNMGAQGLDLDSVGGNFMLYGERNQTVWSSFSHPTDTVVLGQQLVLGMKLVSNVSGTNSSEGPYSLVMEPAGLALYVNLQSPEPYFVWNRFAGPSGDIPVSSLLQTCNQSATLRLLDPGQKIFVQVALLLEDQNTIQNPIPASSNYTTSSALCGPQISQSNYIVTNSYCSNVSLMSLLPDGTLRVYVDSYVDSYAPNTGQLKEDYNFFSETMCSLPGVCGPYGVCTANGQCGCPSLSEPESYSFLAINSSDPKQGCYYTGGPLGANCTANAKQHIGQLKGADYFRNSFINASSFMDMSECGSLCMSNCSCTAAFHDSGSNACYLVSEQLMSLRDTGNSNLTGFVKLSGDAPTKKRSNNLLEMLGVGIASLALVLLCCFCTATRVRYWRQEEVEMLARKKREEEQKLREDKFRKTFPDLLRRYSVEELAAATLGFTKELGSGAYGTVYEGILMDGTEQGTKIAVKKLKSSTGTKDFNAEMTTLGNIHHVNLVRLRGFCAEGEENMLVYEYMSKGSLDRWLFARDSNSGSLLDWKTRFKIAVGTARGLAYLHNDCTERIIHFDIKPQNILLNDEINPKVGDFGLSKLVDKTKNIHMTYLRGTPAYMDPEFAPELTDRIDVYSYGIVLLELVAGRKCYDGSHPESGQKYLPTWVLHCMCQTDILDIVDPRLELETDDKEQVAKVLHIALDCIQNNIDQSAGNSGMKRPSMKKVVQMLEGIVPVPEPKRDTKYPFGLSLDTSHKPLVNSYTKSLSKNLPRLSRSLSLGYYSSRKLLSEEGVPLHHFNFMDREKRSSDAEAAIAAETEDSGLHEREIL